MVLVRIFEDYQQLKRKALKFVNVPTISQMT